FPPLPGERLRAFPEDKDVPADARNATIDETFVPPARVKLPEAKDFAEWKKGMLQQLREKSFRALAAEIPPLKLQDATRGAFVSEPGIEVALFALRKSPEPKTLVVADQSIMDEANPIPALNIYPGDKNPWHLFPRGILVPHGTWTRKSPPNYVERAHALLGRTVDEGRVRDVIAAVKYLRQDTKAPVKIIGVGEAGVLAAY